MKRLRRIVARLLWRLLCFVVRRGARLSWRLARRYRWELAPLALLATLAAVAALLSWRAPAHVWTLPVAQVSACALVAWRVCDRRAEYVYTGVTGAAGVAWSVWFFASPSWEAVKWLLIGGVVAAGPWWWHYRRRIQVRRLLLDWAGAVERAGVKHRVRLSKRLRYDDFGWSAVVTHPGLTTEKLATLTGDLESGLRQRRNGMRFEPTEYAHRSIVRVTTVDLRKRQGFPMPTPKVRTITKPIPIGMGEDGKARELHLFGKHVGMAGTNGSGKSGTQRVLLASLLFMRDVEVGYIDLKAGGVEARLWAAGIPRRNVATTIDEAKALLNRAVQRMNAHGEVMEREGMGSHFKPSRRHKAFVLVIDEGADLIEAGLEPQLNTLFEKGRAVGVWVYYATQYVIAKTLTTRMRANVRTWLGHRVTNRRESEQIYGPGSSREGWRADKVPSGGGWMQVNDEGEPRQERVRAYRINDADIPRLIAAAQPDHDEDQADEPARIEREDQDQAAAPVEHEDQADEQPQADPAAATLAAIHQGKRTMAELMEATGASRATVNRHLSELLQRGAIRRVGRGQYEEVNDGA